MQQESTSTEVCSLSGIWLSFQGFWDNRHEVEKQSAINNQRQGGVSQSDKGNLTELACEATLRLFPELGQLSVILGIWGFLSSCFLICAQICLCFPDAVCVSEGVTRDRALIGHSLTNQEHWMQGATKTDWLIMTHVFIATCSSSCDQFLTEHVFSCTILCPTLGHLLNCQVCHDRCVSALSTNRLFMKQASVVQNPRVRLPEELQWQEVKFDLQNGAKETR